MFYKIKIFLRKLFNIKKNYYIQGFVYLNDLGKMVSDYLTNTIRWLPEKEFSVYSLEEAEHLYFHSFENIDSKFINIF
jgi:hypothetical protein